MRIISTNNFIIELTLPSLLFFKKTDYEGDSKYGMHINDINVGCWYMRYDFGSELNISCILGLRFWWSNL